MKRAVVVSFIAYLLVAVATGAWAIEFSADSVTTSGGKTVTSKIFLKDKKVRTESPHQPGYTIMRGDKDVVWMVMPAQKMYMEMKTDASQQKPGADEKVTGEIKRTLIGTETIDGHPTQKYEITYTSQGKTDKMYQWMATDIKFPIKNAAVDGSWVNVYKNIKMGGQPDSLFEIPSGYTKASMPGMPGGMGKTPKVR